MDLADVDPFKYVGCALDSYCTVHVNLSNGIRAFGALLHFSWIGCTEQDLISNPIVAKKTFRIHPADVIVNGSLALFP